MSNHDQSLNVSHTDIYHKLGILEGKLDALVGLESRFNAALSSMDERVVDLERFRWRVIGMAAGVSGLVAAAVQFVKVFIK